MHPLLRVFHLGVLEPFLGLRPVPLLWSSSFLSSLDLGDELDCTSVCAMCVGVSPLDVRVLPQTKLITSSVPCSPAELEVPTAAGGWRRAQVGSAFWPRL